MKKCALYILEIGHPRIVRWGSQRNWIGPPESQVLYLKDSLCCTALLLLCQPISFPIYRR